MEQYILISFGKQGVKEQPWADLVFHPGSTHSES
jgi:hypothetical protein